MSRYCGENTVAEPILKAAEHWKTTSLLSDRGIFQDKEIWDISCLQKLEFVVEQLDNKNFYSNLEIRLEESGQPEIMQLAAEICWFVYLCPSYTAISQSTKLKRIRGIWEQSNNPFPKIQNGLLKIFSAV